VAESLPAKKRQRKSTAAAAATDNDDDDDDDIAVPTANAKKQTKCTKTGKTMNTYEPDVEMTKEQLTAWRREARRVRNRESAAASRMKTKNRITELEKEVNDYKSKYEAALQKLAEYEAEAV
jgi:predicted  nucleic acid-binding Zn-ribbon protein